MYDIHSKQMVYKGDETLVSGGLMQASGCSVQLISKGQLCMYELHQNQQGELNVKEAKRKLTQASENVSAICNNYYAIYNKVFDFRDFSYTFDSNVVALYDKGILIVGTASGDVFCVAENSKDQVYKIDHVDNIKYVQVTIDITRSTQNAVYNV